MADVLNALLAEHRGRSLDVATAYFTIQGFRLLQAGLEGLGNFRLLLGAEPRTGEQVGLRPDVKGLATAIRRDLEVEPFTEETLRFVEDLIRFLRRPNVQVRLYEAGFLHAKCYLFYNDSARHGWDRFQPVAGIVGSSNFTGPGLTTNRELNLAHKTVLSDEEVRDDLESPPWPEGEPGVHEQIEYGLEMQRCLKSSVGARAIADLDLWFERQWHDARDFKEDLIGLLDASKFGEKEYTPYQVYMKALFEYFRDDLAAEVPQAGRSAVELSEFQEDAVKKARKILARYDGVLIADSVGLGKTWIGKKLLEDYAYHQRQKALVICPASLRDMWDQELKAATIAAEIASQESLGRDGLEVEALGDADVILLDESHNFRNRSAQRYETLERLIAANGGRGRDGARKKLILLTATPINNDLFDLYHQISLFTRGDRGYFAATGIGDLYRYFLHARRTTRGRDGAVALFNLLEEIVIRRTRPFIRKAYPEATIAGKKIAFPDRRLKTERYNLERTYRGIYAQIVSRIENLRLAPYALESYKKAGVPVDEFERGRQEALVGIFKARYLKRFESSVEAFRISIRRALEFLKTFEEFLLGGKVLQSTDFQKILRFLEREDEEDDATPASRADDIEASDEAREILESLETVDPNDYDLRKLHRDVRADVDALTSVWQQVQGIGPEEDSKLQALKDLLAGRLKGKKVLVFSYYKDTVRYLWRELGDPGNPRAVQFQQQAGRPHIRRMDSGVETKERGRVIQAFAPKANKRHELVGREKEKEIDILISTDVLSEGQNLQDCAHLVNYDLHWNPTRMVQRAGRIDRIGTEFDTLFIYNMFPDAGLEELLGLVERLQQKAETINSTGMLDAPIFEGQTVTPRNFNTLRRICEEDGTVIQEEEEFIELASSEFLLLQLRAMLDAGGREALEALPDGIHSGLAKPNAKGMFFYFQARQAPAEETLHFWKYCDITADRIVDNRYLVAQLIACDRDTPRVIGDYDVFGIQEKIIADILRSHEQQQAVQVAPRVVDPIQQTVATLLQTLLNHPQVSRKEGVEFIKLLRQPQPSFVAKELRKAYQAYLSDKDPVAFLGWLDGLRVHLGGGGGSPQDRRQVRIQREDLRLICFDYLCS
jgi:SNF2 family DNA or RNA helicase